VFEALLHRTLCDLLQCLFEQGHGLS